MQDFKKLAVWEKAHVLTLAVYKVTDSFPASEIYGLTSQMRRSAASIPTNIAEGSGRNSSGDFARFLDSASELEYQLILANDLRFLDDTIYANLSQATVEVKRMLAGLIKRVRN